MLTIRKQNFDSQLCYCCNGVNANYGDPKSAVKYRLYHRLPDKKKHVACQVVVPRCKYCAGKMKPILPISIMGGILGAVSGFLYTVCAHGVGLSLLAAALFGTVFFFIMHAVTKMAFEFVYNQAEFDYEIVNVLQNAYGWQPNKPAEGDVDYSFTEDRMIQMLDDLVTNYDCEYLDV